MIIQSIELNNFRNYENLQISFDEGTNILFGDNAQGKTNILEAAYLSGTTKSHKGSKDKEMIRFGTNEAHLRTMVLKKGKQYQIDMHLKHNRSKGIAVNKIPMKKVILQHTVGRLQYLFPFCVQHRIAVLVKYRL